MMFFMFLMLLACFMCYLLGKAKAYGKMKRYDSLPNLEVFKIVFKDEKRVLLESRNKKETFVVPVDEFADFKSLRPGNEVKFTRGLGFTR